MKKKGSPPRKQIEMEKARREAAEIAAKETARALTALFLIVLCDKHGATHEELNIFHRELEEYADQLNKGEIKLHDVYDVLRKEYDIEVR